MQISNILVVAVVLCCLGVVVLGDENTPCDKSSCPGPIGYYESLRCTPVYREAGDCCPYKYNCDHLNEMESDKCYVNGKAYNIGEKLKGEDANPCDKGCFCAQRGENANFVCAVVDCFRRPAPGCYLRRSPLKCCADKEVCLEKPEDQATCVVDGKTYKDGDYFSVASDPSLRCYCQPGYEGQNVEPFCARQKRPYCSPEFNHRDSITKKCAPVYYAKQSPQSSCSLSTRCQNEKDELIVRNTKDVPNEDMTCQFGSITMHYGDELNQGTDYSSVCVKCVCEVGPIPTCQRLPDEECDVRKHPQFR